MSASATGDSGSVGATAASGSSLMSKSALVGVGLYYCGAKLAAKPFSSPHSVFPHHLAAISSAIVRADALCIRNNAASLASQLSHGII